ncbi:MAG: hypothetical protein ABIQ88_16515 [Chitinophagaceae bacterium]
MTPKKMVKRTKKKVHKPAPQKASNKVINDIAIKGVALVHKKKRTAIRFSFLMQ